jgi:dephospho-CoA kinase
MLVIGLTGSIGMGKSTTAEMFREEGAAVYDSDRIVHEIYNGPVAFDIEKAFPGVTIDGAVDRVKLSAVVLNDPQALKRLESIVHPLVLADRQRFLEEQRLCGADVAVVDIPLLFETGAEAEFDAIVVATAQQCVQRERVLARPGMSEEKFHSILARQMSDAEKRQRADFIVRTDRGLDAAREDVRDILKTLRARAKD